MDTKQRLVPFDELPEEERKRILERLRHAVAEIPDSLKELERAQRVSRAVLNLEFTI